MSMRGLHPDLERRFDILELAQALADADDPGAWWTLDGHNRNRYVAMAYAARAFLRGGVKRQLGPPPPDDELEHARHDGFRDAIGLMRCAITVLCLDCDEDTIEAGEFYMVYDDVWFEANPRRDGMLCVGGLEARLERQLEHSDFNDSSVNRDEARRSPRLHARLVGEAVLSE
jgi:hypothetical protein